MNKENYINNCNTSNANFGLKQKQFQSRHNSRKQKVYSYSNTPPAEPNGIDWLWPQQAQQRQQQQQKKQGSRQTINMRPCENEEDYRKTFYYCMPSNYNHWFFIIFF